MKVSFRTRDQLTAMAGTPYHQGVVARVAAASLCGPRQPPDRWPPARAEPAFLLALDRVQDPRNLGAVLRSAEATGAHGLILPKHQSVGLTPGAAKSATGARGVGERGPGHEPGSCPRSTEERRDLDHRNHPEGRRFPVDRRSARPAVPRARGGGGGLRTLVARTCDLLLTLPMKGKLDSLNVAAVAAVLCYEVVRQRGHVDRACRAGAFVKKGLDLVESLEPKVKFCDCWRSSGEEQLPCKQWVGGSNPPASASYIKRLRVGEQAGRYPSGQRGQTVNLLANAFGGSNPPLPTIPSGTGKMSGRERGNSSAVERQPSKLGVAGSNPVSRSTRSSAASLRRSVDRSIIRAHVAQSAERVLGKDEVSGSSPDMGSIIITLAASGGGLRDGQAEV